jgi:hypothetical protein
MIAQVLVLIAFSLSSYTCFLSNVRFFGHLTPSLVEPIFYHSITHGKRGLNIISYSTQILSWMDRDGSTIVHDIVWKHVGTSYLSSQRESWLFMSIWLPDLLK